MSVGIEDERDIWADLKSCLDKALAFAKVVFIPKTCKNVTLRADVEVAATVESGSIVSFETNDYNYEKLSKGAKFARPGQPAKEDEVEMEYVNVVTGPLAVADAKGLLFFSVFCFARLNCCLSRGLVEDYHLGRVNDAMLECLVRLFLLWTVLLNFSNSKQKGELSNWRGLLGAQEGAV